MAQTTPPDDCPDLADGGSVGVGWRAIDAAFDRLYPDQPDPPHVAAVPHPPFTTDGQLYGISAYRAGGPPHWHFVTYGFSELYDKHSDDPAVSGWGFELTFRLPCGPADDTPPGWAFDFLMNLGRYVRRSGNPFAAGHYMNLGGPIAVGHDTAIQAVAFTPDPQVPAADIPNGRVVFLQAVGLTLEELRACGDWVPAEVLGLLRAADPLLVTDLSRRSVLDDPAAADRVRAGIDRDGSSAGGVYVSAVEWAVNKRKRPPTAAATIGAKGADELVRKLRSRLLHGRPFTLFGPGKALIRSGVDSLRCSRNSLLREGIPCVACRSSGTCR